jgi:hypothetical protein
MKAKPYSKTIMMLSGLCAVMLFAGCATQTNSRYAQVQERQLQIGMTKGEVHQLMGNPKESLITSQGESWSYDDNVKALIPFYSLAGGQFSRTVVKFDAEGKVSDWTVATRTSSLAGQMQLSPF